MMDSKITGVLSVKRQLQLLTLPAHKQRRVLAEVGRELQKQTRKNIRTQRDIYGKAFTSRTKNASKAKKRRKLLRKMGKQLVQQTTSRKVTVSFKGPAASIAYKHHHGDKTVMTKARFKREQRKRGQGEAYYNEPATSEQAAVLIKQLGYRRPLGKRRVRVSQSWIKKNMTIGMAGAVIKSMREAKGLAARSGESWTVEIPARPFFAGTEAWVSQTTTEIIEQATIHQLAI